jgi:hypothetical protein
MFISEINLIQIDDVLILSGSDGVSVFTLHRKTKVSSRTGASYVLEKLSIFKELGGVWTSKIKYDHRTGDIYAFIERTVYVLHLESKKVLYCLKDIHVSPVTACIWYER